MTDVQKIWNKVYESKMLTLWLMMFEDKKKAEMSEINVKDIVTKWLKTGKYEVLGIVYSEFCDLCEKKCFGDVVASDGVSLFLCDDCRKPLEDRRKKR